MLTYPPENEERRLHIMALEESQQCIDVFCNPGWPRWPFGARHHGLEGANLEVLFNVDGEEVRRSDIGWCHEVGVLVDALATPGSPFKCHFPGCSQTHAIPLRHIELQLLPRPAGEPSIAENAD